MDDVLGKAVLAVSDWDISNSSRLYPNVNENLVTIQGASDMYIRFSTIVSVQHYTNPPTIFIWI